MKTVQALVCSVLFLAMFVLQNLEASPVRLRPRIVWEYNELEGETVNRRNQVGTPTVSSKWSWIPDWEIALGLDYLKKKYPNVTNWDEFTSYQAQLQNSGRKRNSLYAV